MPTLIAQNLDDAIEQQSPIVIGCRVSGQVVHLTSRFIGRQSEGICVEAPAGMDELVAKLVSDQATIAVAFKVNDEKQSFIATVSSRDLTTVAEGATPIDSLLLQRAVEAPSVQRRKDFRVPLSTSKLTAKITFISAIGPCRARNCRTAWSTSASAALLSSPNSSMGSRCINGCASN